MLVFRLVEKACRMLLYHYTCMTIMIMIWVDLFRYM